jgi:hypothetical protein
MHYNVLSLKKTDKPAGINVEVARQVHRRLIHRTNGLGSERGCEDDP